MEVMRKLANPKVYLFLFSVCGILQGIYFTYFIGVLSTLERRFAFNSSVTSLILIADNLSPAILSIFVGYCGKLTHRPRFLTCGLMVTITSCFFCCLPYFVFGNVSHLTSQYAKPNETITMFNENHTTQLCNNGVSYRDEKCDTQELYESKLAVSVLFLANFLNGCGSTVYYTIGTSYLDDNINKKESPVYLGIFFALKMVGPTLGFMLASASLRLYENPFVDPGFLQSDPRWVGCWWLGFLILSISLIIVSVPIALYPKEITIAENSEVKSLPLKDMLHDLFISLKKLVTNHILMFHTFSIVFQINGIYLYQIYMSKYMENQFRWTASHASFFSGTTKLSTLIAGVLLASILIKLLKPSPRYLTGYMTFVSVFCAAGLASALFWGCQSENMIGLTNGFSEKCSDCGCSLKAYSPVCVGNDSFLSPCFARCHHYLVRNETKIYNSCSCIEAHNKDGLNGKPGHCLTDCNMFWPYFIIVTVCIVLTHTTRVSKVLVTLRCSKDGEKSLTLGAVEFLISILATIPCPFIYGYAIDESCLLWEENCGKRGNCWHYNNNKFRYNFHAVAVLFLTCGCICEGFVFYLSGSIQNFYGPVKNKRQENVKLDEAESNLMEN